MAGRRMAARISLPRIAGVHDSDGNLIAGTADDVMVRDGGTIPSCSSPRRTRPGPITSPRRAAVPEASAATMPTTWAPTRSSVTEAEADDFSADTMTTGTVTVGGTAEGNIEAAGDRDWFGVSLVAGTTYLIDLKGCRTNDGTLADPRLAGIHDSSGDLVSGTVDDNDGHRVQRPSAVHAGHVREVLHRGGRIKQRTANVVAPTRCRWRRTRCSAARSRHPVCGMHGRCFAHGITPDHYLNG